MRFRTRTTSPQAWAGRIRRTVGNHVSNWARTLSRCAASRLRGPCGWRPGRRRAGRDCRRHDRGCAPPAVRLGALGNQRPFELGDGTQHLQ